MAELLDELVKEGADLVGLLTVEECRALLGSLRSGIRLYVDDCERRTSQERERIALYCLVDAVQRIYVSYRDVVLAEPATGLVMKTFPELEPLFDKDGLLVLDSRFILHDGGIQYRDHILHYHQCLRRGFSANPNFTFLYRFADYRATGPSENSFRIAIDHDRLMPLAAFRHLIECDGWYGPRFDPSRLDDLNAVGLTIHRPHPDAHLGANYKLERTEFYWSVSDAIKTFEAEELSSAEFTFDQYNLNRYVHSERDTVERTFRHVDGAVKVYLSAEYSDRLRTQMPTEAKSYRKIKLWRIDGTVALSDWLDLVNCFYKGNEMILEYFDPEQYSALVEERLAWRHPQPVEGP